MVKYDHERQAASTRRTANSSLSATGWTVGYLQSHQRLCAAGTGHKLDFQPFRRITLHHGPNITSL